MLLVIFSFRMPAELRLPRYTLLMLGSILVQIVIGVWQARTGLPIVLVNIHMVLAVILVAMMTTVVIRLKRVVPAAAE